MSNEPRPRRRRRRTADTLLPLPERPVRLDPLLLVLWTVMGSTTMVLLGFMLGRVA